jgi:hypothetical protein
MEFATHEEAGAAWLLKYRHPGTEDLARVMERVEEIAGTLPPSVTLFEKAYRQLYAEQAVSLVVEKMKVPEVQVRSPLTIDEYKKLPASTVPRRYMQDPFFKKGVDELIRLKLI